jgi:hypothetical protein
MWKLKLIHIVPNNSHVYGMRVFGNRVFNRISGAKKGSDWRLIKRYNEELRNLYEMEDVRKGNLKGRDLLEELEIDGRIIVKWMLKT